MRSTKPASQPLELSESLEQPGRLNLALNGKPSLPPTARYALVNSFLIQPQRAEERVSPSGRVKMA